MKNYLMIMDLTFSLADFFFKVSFTIISVFLFTSLSLGSVLKTPVAKTTETKVTSKRFIKRYHSTKLLVIDS